MTDSELLDKLQEYGRSRDNDFSALEEMLDEGIDIRTAISVLGNPECNKPSAWDHMVNMQDGNKDWAELVKRMAKAREEIYSWKT